VEFLFGFPLAAGLVVLFAAVSSTRENRAREYAVMRAVGAGSALLRQVQRAELLGVGALAGLLAALAAVVLGGLLARQVFEFAWAPSPWVPLAGTLAGGALGRGGGRDAAGAVAHVQERHQRLCECHGARDLGHGPRPVPARADLG